MRHVQQKVGGMGGYAEYRFGRLGNFLSNYTYAISLIIANVAIATGVVSYGSYVFGLTFLPWKFVWQPSARLPSPLPSALSDRKIRQIHLFGHDLHSSSGHWPSSLRLVFFSPDIYVAAWNPHDMPFYLTMRDSIAVILWAFLGLETACANSDTVENPEKNVPVAVWQER